jgi:hypothetical protein
MIKAKRGGSESTKVGRLWQFGQEGYREAVSYILPVYAPFTTTTDIQISYFSGVRLTLV